MSSYNQKLLSLIHFYENSGIDFEDYRPFVWGPRALEFFKVGQGLSGVRWRQANVSSVLSLLNEKALLTSALQFPSHRPWLTDVPNCSEEEEDATEVLDPAFLFPLFRLILDACSQSQLDLRTFLTKNALCLCIAGLAARSRNLRAVARHLVSRFANLASEAKFPEKDLLTCLLCHLRNSLPTPDARLPAIHAGFYIRSVSLLAKPEHRMFGVIWKFLLAKPSLNLKLVPEFERLLYSTHIEHRVDRQWLLTVLVDGMREPRDYLVMERSRVFKHVFALSQSRCVDATTQLLALRLVERAVRQPAVAFFLLFHHNLLAWLAIGFRRDTDDRRLAVLRRVLEVTFSHVTAAKSSPNMDALRQELEALRSISLSKESGV